MIKQRARAHTRAHVQTTKQTSKQTNTLANKHTNKQTIKHAITHIHEHTNIQTHKHTSTQTRKHANTQTTKPNKHAKITKPTNRQTNARAQMNKQTENMLAALSITSPPATSQPVNQLTSETVNH